MAKITLGLFSLLSIGCGTIGYPNEWNYSGLPSQEDIDRARAKDLATLNGPMPIEEKWRKRGYRLVSDDTIIINHYGPNGEYLGQSVGE